jgi:hypothetical protein
MIDMKGNSVQIFLNSSNWRFDRGEDPEFKNPLNTGEKVLAYKDPGSQSVCVKFITGWRSVR